MKRRTRWIDAVAMSRRLRRKTSKELAGMTPSELVRHLNEFSRRDPVLKTMQRLRVGSEIASPVGDESGR